MTSVFIFLFLFVFINAFLKPGGVVEPQIYPIRFTLENACCIFASCFDGNGIEVETNNPLKLYVILTQLLLRNAITVYIL